MRLPDALACCGYLVAARRRSLTVPVIGCPGLAVPTGVVDGLPTGVQILAPRFREDLCLAAAEAIEARSGMASGVPVDPVW